MGPFGMDGIDGPREIPLRSHTRHAITMSSIAAAT